MTAPNMTEAQFMKANVGFASAGNLANLLANEKHFFLVQVLEDPHRQHCDWKHAAECDDVDDQAVSTKCKALSWNRCSSEAAADRAEDGDGVRER